MAERQRSTVFGEIASVYDEVRAGYPLELVDAVLDYLGRTPRRVVEVGAGTGKATEAFTSRGLSVVCVEPDPQMAAILRPRCAQVHVCRFEDWTPPPGGVDLLYAAQAWHWVDPAIRWRRAFDALAPGGVVASFGHGYFVVDDTLHTAMKAVYAELAPSLLDVPTPASPEAEPPEDMGPFTDVRTTEFHTAVSYPTDRYLALLGTFSNHRMVPEERRRATHAAVGAVVDAAGGFVDLNLATMLTLGRHPAL